jgi:hypothetical protein
LHFSNTALNNPLGAICFDFGKFEKVEKADGSEVTVAELLDMAGESAFNALLKGFDGDLLVRWLEVALLVLPKGKLCVSG